MPTRGSLAIGRPSRWTTSSTGAGGRVRVVGERDAGLAAEVADQLLGRLAVVVGVVERDLAVGAAEAEPGVGEHHVATVREGLADAGLVVLGPAEAVGGQDRRDAVGRRGGVRHVEVADDVARGRRWWGRPSRRSGAW